MKIQISVGWIPIQGGAGRPSGSSRKLGQGPTSKAGNGGQDPYNKASWLFRRPLKMPHPILVFDFFLKNLEILYESLKFLKTLDKSFENEICSWAFAFLEFIGLSGYPSLLF